MELATKNVFLHILTRNGGDSERPYEAELLKWSGEPISKEHYWGSSFCRKRNLPPWEQAFAAPSLLIKEQGSVGARTSED